MNDTCRMGDTFCWGTACSTDGLVFGAEYLAKCTLMFCFITSYSCIITSCHVAVLWE